MPIGVLCLNCVGGDTVLSWRWRIPISPSDINRLVFLSETLKDKRLDSVAALLLGGFGSHFPHLRQFNTFLKSPHKVLNCVLCSIDCKHVQLHF